MNFGGLWEADLKLAKHHVKRGVGNTKLTIEEYVTIIVRIESFINLRSLSLMSSAAKDSRILSGGHCLIWRKYISPENKNFQ